MVESTGPLESLSGSGGGSVTELEVMEQRGERTLTECLLLGTCGLSCEKNRLVGI